MVPEIEYFFHAVQILVGLAILGTVVLKTGGLIESLKNLGITVDKHVAEDKQAFKDLNNSVTNIELRRGIANDGH
jgi:hypothetical protein